MSQAKVTTVQKARKPYECEKDEAIIAVGDTYRWFVVGFRSKHKHVRCMKPQCTPRPSERESSKLAAIYSAQEQATDNLSVGPMDGQHMAPSEYLDWVRSEIESVSETVREVAGEYSEASTDDSGNVFNTQAEEAAETCEAAADQLESWDFGGEVDPEGCDDHGVPVTAWEGFSEHQCSACEGILDDWANELRDDATAAVDGIEL